MNASPVVVLDSSVVVGGIGWSGGESRQVLVRLALRSFGSRFTSELAAEWADSVAETAALAARWRRKAPGSPEAPRCQIQAPQFEFASVEDMLAHQGHKTWATDTYTLRP